MKTQNLMTGDIVVTRDGTVGGVISFTDYEDCDPIFERKNDVVRTADMHRKNHQNSSFAESVQELPARKVCRGLIQAFYGNRTGVDFTEDDIDGLIAGILDKQFYYLEKFDRSIIHLPDEEGLVLIYNKYKEEERLREKETVFHRNGYVFKPLAVIPEMNIELYSRCLACRMDTEGNPESLRDEDYKTVMKYLAE